MLLNELPGEKAVPDTYGAKGNQAIGFNQYRELAIPIFAKKNKRIEELEEKLEDCELGIQVTTGLNDDLENKIKKLESNLEYPAKEIEELREKIEDLETRLRRKKV